MDNFLKWASENSAVINLISVVIALLSLIVTSLLTVLIIKQTTHLNRKQVQMEQEINTQQVQMQKRQLCVDTYPYKREIYANLFAVFAVCQGLTQTVKLEQLLLMDCEKVFSYYKFIQEASVPDVKAVFWSLREAQFVMTTDISSAILEIRQKFDDMCGCFCSLDALSKVLKTEKLSTELEKIKRHNVTQGLRLCNEILAYSDYMESVMPDAMNIGGIER
ncbi:MAG: hypothetical protein Q4C01_01290 [Clostridia bacterium]|nr:hypothetical protein [Clostridia bacterium]